MEDQQTHQQTQIIGAEVPRSLIVKIKVAAAKRSVLMKDLVRVALEEYLDRAAIEETGRT